MKEVSAYLGAAVLANLTIAMFGPAAAMVVGFALVGLDLTVRDILHQRWERGRLWRNLSLLVATGSVLSWAINRDAGMVALASLAAFAAAGLVDSLLFQRLKGYGWWARCNGSNAGAALVDSLLFCAIAFGNPTLGLMQFTVKLLGGVAWSLVLKR